jgi:hypothetical protein
MGKWKDAFLRSLDPEFDAPDSFEFGAPATDAELSALSAALGAELPKDLAELLREFNGVTRIRDGEKEPYFFDSREIPVAGEYYRSWDCDTALAMEWFKNVAFVCQVNGYAAMWAVVVKPFPGFQYGDVISFDHDRIAFAETAADLFTVNYPTLRQLVGARFKDAG